jgi:DNA-binding PadR family transcriptional regulator
MSMSKQQPTRVTKPTVLVARYLLAVGKSSTYGLEIGTNTGLGSASVYAVLDRFEEYGWVDSDWETDSKRRGARRRLYRVTSEGTSELGVLVSAAEVKENTRDRISKSLKARAT